MNFPEKLEIPFEKYPKDEEYKIGCNIMYYNKKGLSFKSVPLSQFKRNSAFRLYGESIIKDYNYDLSKYTLMYNIENEWYNYFTLVKIN
tara:strand:- start:2654 stop:2920 length:267 start_codon:yes stop_codon:yes gene_type:complete